MKGFAGAMWITILAVAAFFPANAPAQGETVLTMGSWRTEDMEQMQGLFDVFARQHPGIRVVFDPTPAAEYDEVLSAQLKGGTAPDLFYLRSYGASEKLYDAGMLEPLNDLPALRANFAEEMLDPWKSKDGTVYGLPMIATSHGVYYNKNVFERFGLSVPDTWEELLRLAERLRAQGIAPFANASGDAWTINEIVFLNMLPVFVGGREGRLRYLRGERCLDDGRMTAAFQALADLSKFFPANHSLLKYQDSLQLFLQGKAAMWMGGSWDIPFFNAENPSFAWGVFAVPPPAGASPQITFHLDAGVGLNKDSAHKKEALTFLDWMARPEFGRMMADALPGFFPMHKATPELRDPHASEFFVLNKGRGTDVRFVWDKLRSGVPDGYALLLECANGVVNGAYDARQAARKFKDGLAQWYEPAKNCTPHE